MATQHMSYYVVHNITIQLAQSNVEFCDKIPNQPDMVYY